MGYQHIEIELHQQSKNPGMPCGDVFYRKKTEKHTTIILSDGKGHGIKANVAATMNVAYLAKLMETGYSPRAAFFKLIDFLNKVGSDGSHYAVFSIARILNDGVTLLLTYEMPPPIFISQQGAIVLDQRKIETENASSVYEANCYLKNGEAIMLMSDGITQAGIGRGYSYGWGSNELCKFINKNIPPKIDYKDLSRSIMREVYQICNCHNDDDVSSVIAYSRTGKVSTIFTGPPTDKNLDAKYVYQFTKSDGYKIICGGTTASIFAKILGREIKIDTSSPSVFTPPQYHIDGFDLVTEGAVTLNQFYNIIDEDRILMTDDSPITLLYDYIMSSDKVVFYLGSYNSFEETDIEFIQRGIKTRRQIVPLIAERLTQLGKLVVVEWV
jgi:hypothetical protein